MRIENKLVHQERERTPTGWLRSKIQRQEKGCNFLATGLDKQGPAHLARRRENAVEALRETLSPETKTKAARIRCPLSAPLSSRLQLRYCR
jgi:hypothetical protein